MHIKSRKPRKITTKRCQGTITIYKIYPKYPSSGLWGNQVVTYIACANSQGKKTIKRNPSNESKYTYIILKNNFYKNHIYPTLATDNHRISKGEELSNQKLKDNFTRASQMLH